ncbi:unnamed protein product [Paramecium primaurelia]|uniref:Uncharacterized protein n=1 Tax=Paramecium primaurelia TaxID=5886 RepID=A0A8S1JZA6_PARPR|nr:unnamed protein product [Paramecium primaurelia]
MDQTHKSIITEILPNTKRTLERRQKQLEEEQKKKKEQETQQKEQAEKQKKFQQYLIEQERIKKQEEDRKKEEEKRSQEEIQQMNTLKGEYGNMMIDLATGDSKLDYTISGLDLRPTQIRVLVKVTENNNTLKGLSMSRKRIGDEEGQEIAASLEKNMVLERLELEGNNLGPKTLASISKLLEINKSIRVIDLENNNLTNHDKDRNTYDYSGIYALCEAIEKNDTLLQLNLCNCKLDEKCGEALANALRDNTSLICLDITENPKMNLNDVRKCQDYLIRNKKIYDDERYREFQERQRIRNEDQTSTIQMQDKEKAITAQEGIEQRMNARRLELEQQWKEELEKEAKIKEKTVHNLMKQAKLLGKKKGKGGGAKKK